MQTFYEGLERHIRSGPTSLSHSPDFELGIANKITGLELSGRQNSSISILSKEVIIDDTKSQSHAEASLVNVTLKNDDFNVSWISCTSIRVEIIQSGKICLLRLSKMHNPHELGKLNFSILYC